MSQNICEVLKTFRYLGINYKPRGVQTICRFTGPRSGSDVDFKATVWGWGKVRWGGCPQVVSPGRGSANPLPFQKIMTLENIVKNHHFLHLKQTSNNFAFQIIYVGWIVLVLWCLWPVIIPCVPALFSQPLCSSTVTLLLFYAH